MTRSPVSFAIDSETAAEAALFALRAHFSSHTEPAPLVRHTYFDTFDWRLYRARNTLAASSVEGGLILTWRAGQTASTLRLHSREVPAFAWEFSPGSFKNELAGLIEMRRLLPVVTVETEGLVLRLLDTQEKTVARAVLQRGKAEDPAADGRVRDLPAMLRILPVRGYDREHETILRFVEGTLGLTRAEDDELQLALAAMDHTPGDYSSKLELELEPSARADEAAKLIHRTLLRTITANEEGTRHDLDTEFLHDFRVAVRRTRSALRQIKGVYPEEIVSEFTDEFRWLGQVTGPTRDLDVYLLKMADYKATLPARAVKDLEPLLEFLRHRQHVEQRRLARCLDERRYRSLIRAWKDYLEQPVPAETDLPNAQRPIREVASERIWRAYRRVRKKGLAIEQDSPAEALHQLRIDCKKLRYLLEFFRSLYNAADVARLVGALKQLQDNLGDFNDYEVQQERLRTFAEQMVEGGTAPAGTLMAMGRLVERLETGQAEERQRVAKRFGRFSTKKNHARFKRLFKATPRASGTDRGAAAAKAGPEPKDSQASPDPATETTIERRGRP